MRVFALRLFGLLVVGVFIFTLSGCGSGETVQGQAILLDESGKEFPAEGMRLKIFDHNGTLALHRRAEVILGQHLLDLSAKKNFDDFKETYLSAVFALIDSSYHLGEEAEDVGRGFYHYEKMTTDDEGRFDFSFFGNECLVTSRFTVKNENLRWIRIIRRNALNSKGVELRTENQLKFGGAEEFLSIAEIEKKFNQRMAEIQLFEKWKPEIEKENKSETKKSWQPVLSYIPSGTFLMGSPGSEISRSEEEILHEVTISHGFWMGKYEVTNGEWDAVWKTRRDINASKEEKFEKKKRKDHPVTQVSYGRAQAFCWRLTERAGIGGKLPSGLIYRLPTEAEWEYACRAGQEGIATVFGEQLSTIKANYGGAHNKTTTPVGQFKEYHVNSLKWDLYDMHGNVQEWCFDWYGDYPTTAVVGPLGALRGKTRALRGGSFHDAASRCRSASRDKLEPISHSNRVGFRVVLGYPL